MILPLLFATALFHWFAVAQHTPSELDSSLVWGTYRPQVYFGVRAALPKSFLSGLLWFSPTSLQGFVKARHDSEEGQGVDGYGYTYHDGRSFAIQEIRDTENNYFLETSWIKTGHSCDEASPKYGSWAARIKGTVLDPTRPATISPIFYMAHESHSGHFVPLFEESDLQEGIPPSHSATGKYFMSHSESALGSATVRFSDTHGLANTPANPTSTKYLEHEMEFSHARGNWHYLGHRLPSQLVWRGKDIIQSDIGSSVQKAFEMYGKENLPWPADLLTLADQVVPMSNFVAMQRTFQGNFSFDIFYDDEKTPGGELLDGQSLTVALEASRRAYDERLDSVLPVAPEKKNFVRQLTSQIVGGIGYYFGQSIVDRSFLFDHDRVDGSEDQASDPQETEEQQLLTATPSRSKFPRGFYWDEGFHLAHIGAWDLNLGLDILQSWFDLIDEDGWVAREQILGEEARSRVPQEFQTQNPAYGNPPTLTAIFLLDYLTKLEKRHGSQFPLDADSVLPDDRGEGGEEQCRTSYLQQATRARELLTKIYPKLRSHYLWFRRSQRGQVKEWGRKASAPREAYRWRGRTKDHVLTSGLDDYPRASEPNVGELHVDLASWMGAFAEAMMQVAKAIGEDDDVEEYERSYHGIVANLDDLHWSEDEEMYCDSSIDKDDESFHVCHAGYVSLFPLLTGLISPDNPRLGKVLNLIRDPAQVWSDFGVRSLSKKDAFYGQGENYWRGPIWMPINYLILRALKLKYASVPGPFQTQAAQIYEELRHNLVSNVEKEFHRTHYTWEQYHPITGRGQRSHPFSGWTTMAALIEAEMY